MDKNTLKNVISYIAEKGKFRPGINWEGLLFNKFIDLVNAKLKHGNYDRDYSNNLGLSDDAIKELKRTIKTDLEPMIRTDEKFNLEEVLSFFNQIFK